MFALLLSCWVAFAGVAAPMIDGVVRIEATVSDDLRTIKGTIDAPTGTAVDWADLFSQLPIPTSDRLQHRTFPGRSEPGRLWLEEEPTKSRPRSFHSILPRRFGAAGSVPGRGLFINGLWHPHPTVDGRLATPLWDVSLTLPVGATGVLNGEVATGTLHYRGRADRLSLAVLFNARVQTTQLTQDATITLVDRGPPRRKRDTRTLAVAMTGLNLDNAHSFTVVETPLRRRLVRTGPHTVFMSDRALRVTPPDWGTHLPALRNAMQSASLGIADPWLRQMVGSILNGGSLEQRTAKQLAKWRSWMPRVDSFLYDGRSAFATETLKEGWPSEQIMDDPLELTEAIAPAENAAWKLESIYGEAAVQSWATALSSGATLAQACELSRLPIEAFERWRTRPPVTDVFVDVERTDGGWEITLERDAPEGMPSEPIDFQVGSERKLWTTADGPDILKIPSDRRPASVRVDPNARVLQEERQNDVWPRPWSVTLTGSMSEVNISRRRPTASAYVVARNRRSSHWMHALVANTNPVEIANAYYSLGYEFGRKLDRRNRIWRAWAGPSVSLLDPDFRSSADGLYAVDIRTGMRVDTRDNWPFSRKGIRVAAGLSNGFVPGHSDRWRAITAQSIVLANLPGPWVWAHQVKLGSTTSELSHRQFSIGGSGSIQGLPIDAHFGHTRVYGTSELRFSPIREASIPMWMWWVTTVQVTGALEMASVDDQTALGWTAGLGTVSDIWGQTPYFTGIWIARALDYGNFNGTSPTQVYLRLGQSF